MLQSNFTGIMKPTREQYWRDEDDFSFMTKDQFSLGTIMLLGAAIEACLFCILPAQYVVIPTALLSIGVFISTVVESLNPSSNSYTEGVIPGRVSAQLPSAFTSRFSSTPASQSLVVFHLGIRFNHPLGVFAPGVREAGEYLDNLNNDLRKRAHHYGLYHFSRWRGAERASCNSFMVVYYFRDVEGLHRFATDPIHTKAHNWYMTGNYKHLGIFHEVFVTEKNAYETVYMNSHPVLLGAGSVKCVDDESGEEIWQNTLVDANGPDLNQDFKRLVSQMEGKNKD